MTNGHPDLSQLSPASIVVAAGRPPHEPGAPLNPPVLQSSTYVAGGTDVYARASNPAWVPFEETLGALEGGRSLLYSSGLAAIAAALSLAGDGTRVVVPQTAYSNTLSLLASLEQRGRHTVTVADTTDLDALRAALTAGAPPALVWLESPANPTLTLTDIGAAAALAHEVGAIVVVDNTFATPLLQQPLALGADVVVHSVTKYLAGHSDLILGAVVTRADERGSELYDQLLTYRTLHGAIAGPQEAWLALRGLRTLHVRLERGAANAVELVSRLRQRAGELGVGAVHYPGFGAMVAIEVTGGAARADATCDAVRLWTHATSLGGVESLLERRRRHAAEPIVVPEELIRLSVGVEDVEDLWADLEQALRSTLDRSA